MKKYLNKIFLIILFVREVFINLFIKADIYYVVENANWSIKEDGKNIKKYIKKYKMHCTYFPRGIRNSIIHFGSINSFIKKNNNFAKYDKSNKIIVTWFHIARDYPKEIIQEANKRVDVFHTSCELTKNKLIKLGINSNKIIVIPLGIDLNIYFDIDEINKNIIKNKLNINKNKILIGSFQKDGEGWEEGNVPKLIKGPDRFCNIAEKLNMKNIEVILSGPARGYVKNRLKTAGIEYKDFYFKNPNEVAKLYQIIDLYIVASREEGGPKAILESMACGVPILSTRVGMAPDIIKNGENGFVIDEYSEEKFIEKIKFILENKEEREILIRKGLETIKSYNLEIITKKYEKELYKKLKEGK